MEKVSKKCPKSLKASDLIFKYYKLSDAFIKGRFKSVLNKSVFKVRSQNSTLRCLVKASKNSALDAFNF